MDVITERTPLSMEMNDENQKKGVEFVSNSFNDLYDKSLKGLSAAMRIAALCYNSPEIKQLVSLDNYGEKWMEDISSALCALANFDSSIRERIIYSIHKAHEVYDIREIDYHLKDVGN